MNFPSASRGGVKLHVAALAVMAAGVGCKKDAAPAMSFERPPALVRVDVAVAQSVPVFVDEIGRCVARETVNIQPQISGMILTRHFEDGADVKKGDLLFSIDARPFQADVARGEASTAQSRANLDWAKLELERMETVLKSENAGAIRKQDYDQRKNDLVVATAKLAASEAELTMARLRVEYCSIRSPIDGRAGSRLVDAGNVVKAEDSVLVVLHRIDPMDVEFTVTERDFSAVRDARAKGDLAVEARVPGDTGPPSIGKLTFIDSSVRDGSGTVKLRGTHENAARRLWPGLFVNVRLVLATRQAAVLVPAVALQTNQVGSFVFVVNKENAAELRQVQLGQRHGDKVVVDSGVDAGETVVTDGQLGVMPGGKVKVLDGNGAAPRKP